MMGRRRIALLVSGLSVGLVLVACPRAASAQDVTSPATGAAEATPPATRPDGVAGDGDQRRRRRPGSPAHMSVARPRRPQGRQGPGGQAGPRLRLSAALRPGEHVRVKLVLQGKVRARNVNPEVNEVQGTDKGRFNFRSKDLIAPGSYKVMAEHERTAKQRRVVARSTKFGVDYPDLDPGDRSSVVRTFNQLLNKRGLLQLPRQAVQRPAPAGP